MRMKLQEGKRRYITKKQCIEVENDEEKLKKICGENRKWEEGNLMRKKGKGSED